MASTGPTDSPPPVPEKLRYWRHSPRVSLRSTLAEVYYAFGVLNPKTEMDSTTDYADTIGYD